MHQVLKKIALLRGGEKLVAIFVLFFVFLFSAFNAQTPGAWVKAATVNNAEQTISNSAQQDFSQGVLAVNTDQSVYQPGDTVALQMGAIDKDGHTECLAQLNLQITAPSGNIFTLSTKNGAINYSKDCGHDNVTDQPDYTAFFKPEEIGGYTLRLTNGDNLAASDHFEVVKKLPFIIKRTAVTRINPIAPYRMSITVTALQDYAGNITEQVPANFDISKVSNGGSVENQHNQQQIIWPAHLTSGEVIKLEYTYQAPTKSPEFYFLGPLSFQTLGQIGLAYFQEARQWQVAADTDLVLFVTSGSTWTPPDDWTNTNKIETIGAGGGGRSAATKAGGAGGGAYSFLSNTTGLTARTAVNIGISSTGGTAGNDGGDTWLCNSTSNCVDITGSAVIVGSKGGKGGPSGGSAGNGGAGGLASASVPSANAKDGGTGGTGTQSAGNGGGGGAGGKGGPTAGKTGGNGDTNSASTDGGGGGGGAGGASSAVGTAGGATFGAGGAGPDGTGGGATSGAQGTDGKGGGGAGGNDAVSGGKGGNGAEWDSTHGSGGGGGGAGNSGTVGGDGGTYGGGGGGGTTGGTGGAGLIVVTYTPASGCFAKTTGNWSVGANWNGCGGTGGIPASTDNVTISTGITITIDASANTPTTTFTSIKVNGTLNTSSSNFALLTQTLNIASGGTLTANGSTITLTGTSGTIFTDAGTFTAGTSTVIFNGNASNTLTSNNTITFNNLQLTPAISANRTYTFGTSALTINGNFDVKPTATTTSIGLTVNMGANITVGATKTTTIQPGATNSPTAKLASTSSNFNLSTGLLNIDSQGGGGTLDINNSTLTLTGTSGTIFTKAGTFTVGGTSTTIFNGDPASSALTLTSNNAITFDALQLTPITTGSSCSSTVGAYKFGTSALTINGNFDIKPTAGSASKCLNVYLGAATTVAAANTTTIQPGATNSPTAKLDVNAFNLSTGLLNIDSQGGGGTLDIGNTTLTITGTSGTLFTKAGTFTVGGTSTTIFNGNGTATLTSNNTITFDTLQLTPAISASKTYTFGTSALTINGNFDVKPTATTTSIGLTVNMGANITVGATKTTTIQPGATNSPTAKLASTSSNFNLSTGLLNIDSQGGGGTLDINNSTLTLTGTSGTIFTKAGTFTVGGTSTTIFNGDPASSALTLTSNNAITFDALQLTPITTGSSCSSTVGAYKFGTSALTINGNFDIKPTAGSASKCLNVYLGAATTVAAANTTTIQPGATNSPTAKLDVNAFNLSTGLLNIDSQGGGGTLDIGNTTLTITGTSGTLFTKAGTFTVGGTSTTIFNGNGTATLTSNNTITFDTLQLTPAISASKTYTFGTSALTINGNFDIKPTATTTSIGLTVNMGNTITVGATKTITIQPGATNSPTAKLDTVASANTISTGFLDIEANGTLAMTGATAGLTMTGTTGTLMTINGTGSTFTAGTSTVTINGNGSNTINSGAFTGSNALNNLTINITGVSKTLGANLTASGTTTVTLGTLDTSSSNYTLSTGAVSIASSTSAIFTTHASTVLLTGTGTVWSMGASGVFTSATSTIKLAETTGSATAKTFAGGGKTYNNIWFAAAASGTSTGSITVSGSNTFADFKDDNNGSGAAHSILFTNGTTTTVTTWTVSGTSGNVITINSDTTATHTLTKATSGTISSSYLNIQHSVANGTGAIWNCFTSNGCVNNNSVATAGSGWVFVGLKTISDSGGTRNWNDTATWTDGVVPLASDDVVATATSGNVTINVAAVCRSIDLTGYTGTITHNAGVTLSIGDATAGANNNALVFPSSNWTYTLGDPATSEIDFVSTSTTQQSINTGGQTLGNVTINGAGSSYKLLTSNLTLGSAATFKLTAGTFTANALNVTAGLFSSSNSNTRTLTMSTGTWTINGSGTVWDTTTVTGLTQNQNTSTISFTGGSAQNITTGGKSFYNVTVNKTAGTTLTLNDALTDTGTLTLTQGTFTANNFNVTTGNVSITGSSTRVLTMGSGTWSLTRDGSAPIPSVIWDASTTTNLTLNANTSTIKDTSTTGGVDFRGGGLTYNNLWFARGSNTGSNTIEGKNTFNVLKDDGTVAHIDVFPNVTTTVTTWKISGFSTSAKITINGTGTNVPGTFTVSGTGTQVADNLIITNSNATGGATWYAGSNSTDNGGNTGWTFTDEPPQSQLTISDAGGNWNSPSTWVEGRVPTSSDNVVATATSGNLTINAAASCRSIDLTGYTKTLTHNSGVTLSIGDGTAGTGNNALIFPSSTYSAATSTSAISFISTSTTAQNVNFNAGANRTGNIDFNGAGGSWKLTGGISPLSTATITLTQGTLDTNGQTVDVGGSTFNSSNPNTRTLTLGASSFVGVGTWNLATTTGLTFNANTSSITLSTSASSFQGGGLTYNSASLTGSGTATITGANTFANLTRTGTAAKTDALQLNANQTVTGTLTINGNSVTNRLLVTSDTLGTARTLTAATVTVTNADFRDITGAGAGSWNLAAITGNSGDAGGNSGITFTTAATQTWSGTSGGNWSANAWTSRVPLPQDNVVINAAFSASQTVTLDMPRAGKSIDWTGATGTPAWALSASPSIYGSVTMISGMTVSGTGIFTMAGRGSFTWTSGGQNITNAFAVSMFGGTLTVQDSFLAASLTLNNGIFDANNTNLTIGQFFSNNSNTRTITMGSGTWTLTGATPTWNIATTTNLTFNANTSTIKITDTANGAPTFSGGGLTYYNLWYSRGTNTSTNTITGANTFNDIKDDGTAAHQITFPASTTTTVTTFTVSGADSAHLISLRSSTSGTQFTLSDTTGTNSQSNLDIKDSNATGGATWNAGNNSINTSNNTGWNFNASATRTISNAGGNWNATTTWVEGIVPTALDNVVATGTSGNVTITANANCRSIDLTGYVGTLTHNAGVTLSIGDGTAGTSNNALIFPSSGWTYTLGSATTSAISFISTSTTAQNVNFNGKTAGNVTFNGSGGSWKLTGTLNTGTGTSVTLTNGTLDTNGQAMTIGALIVSNNSNTKVLTLGASSITANSTTLVNWNIQSTTNLTFNANTSTITASGGITSGNIFIGGGLTYNNVSLTGSGNPTMTGANTFSNLTRTGTAATTDGLSLSANQTITGTLTLNGNSATNRILVTSDTLGTARTLTAATVTVTNADFRDITGAGAGSWNLAAITGNSGDAGGNSGITFTTAAQQTWSGTSGGNWSANAWTSRVPLPQDNVVINAAFSASQTVTLDMPRAGKSIDWTGATGTPAWAKTTATTVYGSVTMISGMTNSGTTAVTMEGRGSFTWTSGTQTWTNPLYISMDGGTLTMQDNFVSNSTTGVAAGYGTLDAGNKNITVVKLTDGCCGATLTMGSGTWTLTGTGTVWNLSVYGNTTINSNTSTIAITDTSSTSKSFDGNGFVGDVYYNLSITGGGTGGVTINNNGGDDSIFNNITIGAPKTVSFSPATTQTINGTFTCTGSAGNLITLKSVSSPNEYYLNKPSGTVSCDYLSVKDSVAEGGAHWYAGANSTDSGHNTGWIFQAAPTTETISDSGGSRNWDDPLSWVEGRVPTSDNNVVATGTSGNLTINVPANVRSIDLTGYVGTLTHNAGITLSVGDAVAGASNNALIFPSSDWTYTLGNSATSAISFISTSTTQQTINTGGKTLGNVTINGSGSSYKLATNALTTSGSFTITAGTFDVTAAGCTGSVSCNMNVAGNWSNSGTFTARTGTVTLNGVNQSMTGNTSFYNLTKQENTNNSTDSILTVAASSTQTILTGGTLDFDGLDSNDMLNLVSSSPGTRYTFTVTDAQSGTWLDVTDSNASTSDITCTSNCVNGGNNDDGEASPHWIFGSTASFDQKHYRFFRDNYALNTADWYAAEDTNLNVGISTNFRLRFEVANTGAAAGNVTRRLEFRENTGAGYGAWTQITTGTNDVRLVDSTLFTDGDATTSRLTAVGSFQAGQGKDTGSDTTSISLTNGNYTEDEFSLILQSTAGGNAFQFRITNAGTVLDTYTVTPTISTADNTPPVVQTFNPVNNATIPTATPRIYYTLDEAGDCKASTTNASYSAMSGADCTGDGSSAGACLMPSLGSNGSKTIYFACQDTWGNQDTSGTTDSVTYTLTSSSGQTNSIKLKKGNLKVKGSLKVK